MVEHFYLIGAPKCGTTSLAAWLSAHSEVYIPPQKEIHYFNSDMKHRFVTDRTTYESVFAGVTRDHRARGDASVWYLYSREAVPNIEEYSSGARYIVCLRNPVDMAYSLHGQQVYSLNEDVLDFADAWNLSGLRSEGGCIPANCQDPTTLIYTETCMLGEQIQRLLECVPRERVQFLMLSDLAGKPQACLDSVTDFLGLKRSQGIVTDHRNAARVHRSRTFAQGLKLAGRLRTWFGIERSFGILRGLETLIAHEKERPTLPPEVRRHVADTFRSDVDLLWRLTGLDLSRWEDFEQ